jgi:hypothetical protein
MPLCDTPDRKRKTADENIAEMCNELRMLMGGQPVVAKNRAGLEALMEALVAAEPLFKFRTWKGPKQTTGQYAGREPRVNHVWGGRIADDAAVSVSEDVVDESTASAELPEEPPDEGPEDAAGAGEGQSLQELATAADNGDPDAMDELAAVAKEAGVDHNEYQSWQEVADLLEPSEAEEEQKDDEQEEGEWEPQVGDSYLYRPFRAKKDVAAEVQTVNKAKQTVTLKLADGRVFKGIAWDKLKDEEE